MMLRACVCLLTLAAVACGGGGYAPGAPTDTRRTSSFAATLDDPARCTCDAGGRTYGIQTLAAGRVDAVATVQPAEARLVVRLLDSNLNTIYAVSTQQGATARLGYDAPAAAYALQVFLASDGPRQASFQLEVKYP